MLAALLTDIEGAGHGFDRGFVTYTKESKAELLGIEPKLLDRNDAVSEVVARAMAEGALKRSEANIALGVTGFAGPAGPARKKALSTWRSPAGQSTVHRVEHFGAIGRGAGSGEIAQSDAGDAGAGARRGLIPCLFLNSRETGNGRPHLLYQSAIARTDRPLDVEEVGQPYETEIIPYDQMKSERYSRSIR